MDVSSDSPTYAVSPVSQAAKGAAPGFLMYGAALLMMGIVVQTLYRVSPNAAYLLVILVLLAFAGSGGNAAKVQAFFRGLYNRR